MKRLLALVLLVMAIAVPAQAATVGPSTVAQQAQEGPAVVIDDSEGLPEEAAWTFRFLVPTLLALTLALVAGLFFRYQRGFKGRYRIRE